MSLRSQAISSVKWNSISTAFISILHFVRIAILARLLDPSDFGLMGMVLVVIGFAQLFADIGVSNAIIYKQDSTIEELSSLYWLSILSGFIIYIIIYLFTPLITLFYHEPLLNTLIPLTGLIFLITPLGQQFQTLMQRDLQFDYLSITNMLSGTVNTIITITCALLDMGVFSLVCGQFAETLTRVFLLTYRGLNVWRPRFYFSLKSLSGYIGFGMYQMGERCINYLNSNLDYLLIGSLLGAQTLGYYTLAYNLILMPTSMINPIINRVAFPVFSKLQNDIMKLKNGYLKTIKYLSSVNFPIIVGIAAVAPVAVPLILGDKWFPSIILIQILSIVGLLRSLGNPVGSLLLSRGRADLGFKWNLMLMITQIPGLYLGAKLGGAIGVATAFSILMIIYSVLNYFVLIKTLIGKCFNEYFSSIWPAFWISAIMALIVLLLSIGLKNISSPILLFFEIVVGAVVYISLFYIRQKPLMFEIKDMILK